MSEKSMTLTVLCTGLANAVAKDEAPEVGGFDLSAGMFGPNVSAWLREVADELCKRSSTPETVPARPCVWRTGCKHPAVCDQQGVCVPGGEATDCTCNDYPGADEFCTAHKSQPCGAPLDADGVDKCERQKGHTGVCGLDPV